MMPSQLLVIPAKNLLRTTRSGTSALFAQVDAGNAYVLQGFFMSSTPIFQKPGPVSCPLLSRNPNYAKQFLVDPYLIADLVGLFANLSGDEFAVLRHSLVLFSGYEPYRRDQFCFQVFLIQKFVGPEYL